MFSFPVLTVLLVAWLSLPSLTDAQQGANLTTCPLGWTQERNSCYFTGERFDGQSWYSASSFCLSFGAHLVEINDLAEYNYIMAKAQQVSWTNGPWVGLLRQFGDKRWVLPSIRMASDDDALNKLMEDFAAKSAHDCGGLNAQGKEFGFWRCRDDGSPLCEIDLRTSAK